MVASLPRIVNIGSLDIQVSKETQAETRLKVAGKARTYRFLTDEV
jgi:Tfp pilus assembly protein PilO